MMMDDKKPESRTTAAEVIGSSGGHAADAPKETAEKAPEKAEEVVRQAPTQAGSSAAAKTAAAVGEKVSDAYADPADHAAEKPIGDIAGLLIHGRR
jgi:hypothetical protein